VWAQLLEWCADLFAANTRPAKGRIVVTVLGLLVLAYFGRTLASRFALEGFVPAALLIGLALLAARRVFVAREEVWRAACLPLEDPRQTPSPLGDASFMAPTALALSRLALAIDAVRRGRYADANDLVGVIGRQQLRLEEQRLLDAVRGMISLGLGDDGRAALQAAVALPTGSDDIDRELGRALLRNAWRNEARVHAIDQAWAESGIEPNVDGTLPRLRRLIRVRVGPSELEEIAADDARELAEEAMAVGDGDLAAELAARGRGSRAYR
jgi:hypothetical protein